MTPSITIKVWRVAWKECGVQVHIYFEWESGEQAEDLCLHLWCRGFSTKLSIEHVEAGSL